MSTRKIDPDLLLELVSRGKKPVEMAKILRVAPSSVTRYLKNMRIHAPKIVILEKSGKYAEIQNTFIDQYNEGIQSLLKLKRALEKYIYNGDRQTFVEMQRMMESKSVEQGDKSEPAKDASQTHKRRAARKRGRDKKSKIERRVERFDFSVDPKALLVQVNRAIADYLRLKIEFFEVCMDAEKIIPFIRDMTGIIARTSPELKYEVEEALKRHQLIRSIVTFDSGIETTGRDQGGGGLPMGDPEEIR